MVTREEFLQSIGHEIEVCIHLHGKIPEGGLDYRPSEKQRTTLELMRYLSTCVIGPFASLVKDDWSEYDRYEKEVADMTSEEFPEIMRRQLERFRDLFTSVSDQDLAERIVRAPGVPGDVTLGMATMRTAYAWLVAYRHELMLRVKASGNMEIGTANNWMGVDWKPKKEKVAEEDV